MTTFTEKTTRNWFQCFEIDSPPADLDLDRCWGSARGATHVVRVSNMCAGNPLLGSPYRFARVLKTVAYIGTDIDDDGNMVWDRWQIRQNS